MTAGMTWRRHEVNPRQHLGLACHLLEAAALDEFRERVILRMAGVVELCSLHEDRDLAQRRVTAAVVEVQVAVRGQPDIREPRPDGRQRLAQPGSAWPVIGVNLGMGAHASIEQDHSLRVADDVAQARFHSEIARPGLLRRPHEVAEINTPHRDVSHSVMFAASRRGSQHRQRSAPRRRSAWLLLARSDGEGGDEPAPGRFDAAARAAACPGARDPEYRADAGSWARGSDEGPAHLEHDRECRHKAAGAGAVRAKDAPAYAAYVQETGIEGYQRTPGNRGAWRVEGDQAEFITVSFWESRAAIEAFAGQDIEKAIFYPDDERFLIERDLTVHHYEVAGTE